MYGGTKTEMQRLISDAAMLSDTVDAQSMSFANIVEAIHVVQTEMGITGTTAKEAATTISGSVSSMKAAWQNLLTGVADDTQDFDRLVNEFIDSVLTVGDNVLPRFETSLLGIVDLAERLLPEIVLKLPEIASRLVPEIIDSASAVLGSFISFFGDKDAMERIGEAGANIILSLGEAILTNAVALVQNLPTALAGILEGVRTAITSAFNISDDAFNSWNALDNAINNNASNIDGYISDFNKVIESQTGIASEATAAVTYTENLWKELQKLADENGNVQESNQKRAEFILTELKEAYNVESELINGQISDYQNLKATIEDVIETKKWEIVESAGSEVFKKAIEDETGLHMALAEATQLEEEAKAKYLEAQEKYTKRAAELTGLTEREREIQLGSLNTLVQQAYSVYVDAQKNVETATLAIKQNVDAQIAYQEASMAAQEGNFSQAVQILQTFNAQAALELENLEKSAEEKRVAMQNEFDLAVQAIGNYLDNVNSELVEFNQPTLSALESNAQSFYNAAENAGENLSLGLAYGLSEKYDEVDKEITALETNIIDRLSKLQEFADKYIGNIVQASNSAYEESSVYDFLKDPSSLYEIPTQDRYAGMDILTGSRNDSSGVNITQNIYTSGMTPSEAMAESRYQFEMAMIK